MSDSKQSNKLNRFFAEFIAKLRKWLNKTGSPIRISRRFVRELLGASRGQRKAKGSKAGGFILPTVTLVTLVVTLLVVTMVARSSDRARSAANARSEQVFRAAATPIVDRARAKLEALLSDDKLPRTTPAETVLDTVITGDGGKYTFPDETRLQLVYNIDTDSKIKVVDPKIEKREYVSTAWKFPIDTDNNGLFDSYGLYSILFRSRTETTRPISPLEARSLPMDESTLSGACVSTGGVTNVATQEGWSPSSDSKLKKAFFVYAVTVPIKDTASFPANAGNYEVYNGTTSISAIELQQDRARSPQNNNAVWFEGDTELVNVATFRLNGRVYSGGNLMVGVGQNLSVTFFQVSSSGDSTTDPKKFGSCYYEKKNSEIVVAGNVVEGDAVFSSVSSLSPNTSATGTGGGNVKVHLFQGVGVRPDNNATGTKLINETTQSVDSAVAGNLSKDLALNDLAYSRRIKALVDEAVASPRNTFTVSKTLPAKTLAVTDITSVDPPSVQEDIVKRILDEGLSSSADLTKARRAALTSYFKERTRKVSYGEVPLESPETIPTTGLFNTLTVVGQTNDELVPRRDWVLPTYNNAATFGRPLTDFSLDKSPDGLVINRSKFDGAVIYATDDATTTALNEGNGSLRLLTTSSDTKLALSASEPSLVTTANKETLLGDRVLVGNNLPAKWLKYNSANDRLEFVGDSENSNITSNGSVLWDASTSKRFRNTRALPLSNLGASDRGGFWELSAAADPSIIDSTTTPIKKQDDASPRFGGLRVVTNAGIYSRLAQGQKNGTFLPRFRTGTTDDSATTTVDESSAPVWKGRPQDNLITTVNELKFATPTKNFVVWQDSMPMTGGILPNGTQDTRKGDLQMRATAVYHYKYSAFDPLKLDGSSRFTYQLPVACVSSYYDPTTATTAKNGKAQNGTTDLPWNYDANGRSNNGIVYDVKYTATDIPSPTYTAATELFDYTTGAEDPSDKDIAIAQRLFYQANLIFPNGRFANESLRNVLLKLSESTNVGKLTLSEQSTLDSNICALTILDGTSVPNTSSPPSVQGGIQLPHGSFRESAFLNGREVKSLNRNESLTEGASGNNATDATSLGGLSISAKNRGDIYDLQIEQRQPLEVRVTDIDIDRLRGSQVTGQPNNNGAAGVPTEYLLPYSGIVYATREDALADLSYYKEIGTTTDPTTSTDEETRKTFSPLDFRLDPTRRPSGIRLINGYRLWRSALDTANLGNVDGTAPVSVATSYNSTYKWTEATKGEKGLTLVSNLPVYIKAQYDPKSGVVFDPATPTTAPSFNKHTQEEFTSKLNETVPTITDPVNLDTDATITALNAIWDNFYTRYADDSSTNRLNPNFACRPYINTACTDGDEWRPANIIADSATVLSANFRDGYRTDGDFDLRNNAHTSTSLNWQSQLNPNSEKQKNSSYVLERRQVGFFNNDYVTSFNWLDNKNSDGKQWTATSPTMWMGKPQTSEAPSTTGSTQTKIPQNGNMSSYNANGTTPVQRRLSFNEYGMEICRKLPLSECTFADWVKDGAGTTALPTTVGSDTDTTTPTDAPRYIDPSINGRFARRLSFLRYDDLYKDGNNQLVMSGRCESANATTFPIPIAIQNGNLSTGFTYPQLMGSVEVPLNGTGDGNKTSYGTLPCPQALAVEIFGDPSKEEGRRINYHRNTVSGVKDFSLRNQLGTDTLPDVDWTIADTDTQVDTAPNPTKGTVTTRADAPNLNSPTTSPPTPPRQTLAATTTDPAPAISPPIDSTEYSTNNAVYRRFDFQIRLNSPFLLPNGATAAVRLTIYPTGTGAGFAIPAITATNLDATRTLESSSTLTRNFNTTVPSALLATRITPTVNDAGGDYINRIYSYGNGTTLTTKNSAGAAWDSTNIAPIGTVLKRLPIDTAAAIDDNTTVTGRQDASNIAENGVASPAPSSTPESARPENAKCPVAQYCTIISWTGNGTATQPTNDPWIKNLTVLVVRDSASEPNETFGIRLDNVKRSDGGSITYVNTRTRPVGINAADPGNPPTPNGCYPTTATSGTQNRRLGGYDDRELLKTTNQNQCGSTGGTDTGMLPGYFIHANGHLGAAYPFKFLNTDGSPTTPAQKIRTFAPPLVNGTNFDSGRFVWGVNKAVGASDTIDSPEENVFPDIPGFPSTDNSGAIPMLPGDPALAVNSNPSPSSIGVDTGTGGVFRQGMTRNLPPRVNRALWYKTVENRVDAIGTSTRTHYQRDRNLFINNMSFPAISTEASNKANLNTFGRLMLPPTVCINNTTGQVDEFCVSKDYAMKGNSASTDTLLNLNLPYNPYHPSNETSDADNGPANDIPGTPATAFSVCGATSRTRTFQPYQIRGEFTGSRCATEQTTTIANFLPSTDGSGIRSAKLNPNDATFAALIPDDTKTSDRKVATVTSIKTGTIDVALRAKNTYSNNKINVYDFKKESLGNLSGTTRTLTGKITLRANCIDPSDTSNTPTSTVCSPTSRRLGPSPVFVLRADSAEDIVFDGLRVLLDGVDPNNVFWVFPKTAGADNLVFKTTDSTKPNVVTGNFLGVMPASTSTTVTVDNSTDLTITGAGTPTLPTTSFRGVRFLGFRSLTTSIEPMTSMAALTTVNQPELLPVLQVHFPNRTTADTNRFIDNLQPALYDSSNKRKDSGINGLPKTDQGQWTIRPARSEINAYFVAGMTPSRNGMSYKTSLTAPTSSSVNSSGDNTTPNAAAGNSTETNLGETGGGLANFIRLLENWEAVPLKITGGFLQNTRSVFSTAPFSSTSPFISSFGFSDIQTLFLNPVLPTARMSGYNLEYQSAATQRIPYYTPPIRLWGYDVGLLTQQPDRFAERFATPIPGANEFFREVSADDNWIKILLCALEPNDPTVTNTSTNSTINVGSKQQFGTKPQNYTKRALRGNDLRSDCSTTTYGGATPVYDPAS